MWSSKLKIFIDPVYYYNPRGIGVVTRKIHQQIIREFKCDLILGEKLSQWILKHPFLFLTWEQFILPLYLYIMKVDLFVATGGTAPYFLPKSTKQILWVHDLYYLESDAIRERGKPLRRRLGQFYRKALLKKILGNSQQVVAISEFTRSRIFKLTQFRKSITVIYNQTDEPIIDPTTIEKEEICVIFTGPAENKNPYFVRSLLEVMSQNKSEFRVVVLGLPPHLQVLSKNIEYHNFLPQKELDSLLSKSKVSIVPSTYEGFGLPVVESIFNHCVPLTFDIPVFKEINPIFCNLEIDNTDLAFNSIRELMLFNNTEDKILLAKKKFREYNRSFENKVRELVANNA